MNKIKSEKMLPFPKNPENGWGIVNRKRVASDWFGTLILSGFALSAIVMSIMSFLDPSLDNPTGSTARGFLTFFAVILSLGVLFFAAPVAAAKPEFESAEKKREAFWDWRENIFIPYLESTYGMKILDRRHVLRMHWNEFRVIQNERIFSVSLEGTQVRKASKHLGDGDYYYCDVTLDEEAFGVYEIVKPESVSYRAVRKIN